MKHQSYPVIPGRDQKHIDMNGGFLCYSTHWRPNPDADDPEMPGDKLQMTSYIPLRPQDICLCGSGKTYAQCCRNRPYWQMICPDFAWQGYSLFESQSATYDGIDGDLINERLMGDARLQCVEDTLDRAFWILWGDPALESEFGIMCFGDIELQHRRKLYITTLSSSRMIVLSGILEELMGEHLPKPKVVHDPIHGIDKRTGKKTILPVRRDARHAER